MHKPGHLARHITLRQLQIFAAVARMGGYTKAARTLHLTQPTVSMQVKKLSEAMEAELFETSGKRLALTPEGEKLLDAAATSSRGWRCWRRNARPSRARFAAICGWPG